MGRFINGINTDPPLRIAALIITIGLILRVSFWAIYPPVWKLHAVFNPVEMSVIDYMSGFASYKAGRMPFFDVLSAAVYLSTSQLFGFRALTLFNLIISCVSLPFFYGGVNRYFRPNVALLALTLYALFPKFLVLTGRGFPEAASVAFLVISFYGIARGEQSGSLSWFSFAGVFALVSYLMFVPAVVFAVLVTVYLHVAGFNGKKDRRLLIPKARATIYGLPSGIVGVLYLLFGPIRGFVTRSFSNEQGLSVFTDPSAYTIVEKVFWYLFYLYFDFWWHLSGFDRERGIRPLLESLQSYLAGLFPIYLVGWFGITCVLSVTIVYGIYRLSKSSRRIEIFTVTWIITYVVIFNVKNIGWVGGFQTRHVFPIFPALCIAFGVGGVAMIERANHFIMNFPKMALQGISFGTLMTVLLLTVLVVNGAAQGVIRGEKHLEGKQEPIEALRGVVEPDETVGVVTLRDYHDILIYSGNRLRPSILVGSEDRREPIQAYTVNAEIRTVDSTNLGTFNVTYLYLRVEHNYLERIPYTIDVNESFVDQLVRNHDVVHQAEIENNAFRTTRITIFIVKIE